MDEQNDPYSFSPEFLDFINQATARDPYMNQDQQDVLSEEEDPSEKEDDSDEDDMAQNYEDLKRENESLQKQIEDYRFSDNQSIQNDDLFYEKYQQEGNSSIINMLLNDNIESSSTTDLSWLPTKSNKVNINNVDSRLSDYLNTLPDNIREKALVTSGNDQEHAENSLHYDNKALDLRYYPELHNYIKNDPTAQAMGISVLNPNHGTAKHTHIQVKKFGGQVMETGGTTLYDYLINTGRGDAKSFNKNRTTLAKQLNIENYSGTKEQNIKILSLLQEADKKGISPLSLLDKNYGKYSEPINKTVTSNNEIVRNPNIPFFNSIKEDINKYKKYTPIDRTVVNKPNMISIGDIQSLRNYEQYQKPVIAPIINREVSKRPVISPFGNIEDLKNYENYQKPNIINREVSKKPSLNPFGDISDLKNYENYKNPVEINREVSKKPTITPIGNIEDLKNYENYKNPSSNFDIIDESLRKSLLNNNYQNNIKPSYIDNTKYNILKENVKIDHGSEGLFDMLSDKVTQAKNWWNRNQNKTNDNLVEKKSNIDMNINYNPTIVTGDTIMDSKRQYHLPEMIDLNNTYLGTRNRGDFTPIDTPGGVLTAFDPFTSSKEYFSNSKDAPNSTYIGVDNDGKLKVGNKKDFLDKDYKITKTFSNKIVDFKKDKEGKPILVNSDPRASKTMLSPSINVLDDTGKIVDGKLSMLIPKGNKNTDSFGSVTGGRYIFKTPDGKTTLVSGSFNDLQKAFYKIKADHPYVEVVTLDNGSYTRGLRTKDQNLTASDLKAYDLQNSGGGNFAYIKPSNYSDSKQKYKETFNPTPNVRTINDESYKKGHSIKNEQSAVVLHHTAFTDPNTDRSGVNDIFMTPGKASAHIVINTDGSRTRYANPDQVAFHAGESKLNGRDNVNDFSIGVEFQGDTNKKPLTNDQINSFVEYIAPLIKANKIKLSDIVTHEQIRNQYNKDTKDVKAEHKPDISDKEYKRIIEVLKKQGLDQN